MIHKMCPNQAEKITGMLLEMDESEVLIMLKSKELLEAKVCSRMQKYTTQGSEFTFCRTRLIIFLVRYIAARSSDTRQLKIIDISIICSLMSF